MATLRQFSLRLFILLGLTVLVADSLSAETNGFQFEVRLANGVVDKEQTGRLIIVLSRDKTPEPRTVVTRTGLNAPCVLACDADKLKPGDRIILDQHAKICPVNQLSEVPAGDYFVQALFNSNHGSCVPNTPGDLYSDVQEIHWPPNQTAVIRLSLDHQLPDEPSPPDTEQINFIKIPSPLLSRFQGHPVFLHAGIVLPRDYAREPAQRYPLWIRIGGYGTRYTVVRSLMAENSKFQKTWLADDAPRMILLQLDGDGPYGDSFQVNSANNGPYGDAVVQELVPYIERHFRAMGSPSARVLSGSSTGGWAALALQIFYPDFFNGVWCFCPDPVDFRAFELVNLYSDTNAYVNRFGFERPSERTVQGEVQLTLRHELLIENVLGRGGSWTESGCDWCAWNAAFGPCAADGRPMIPWDPVTGSINGQVTEKWKDHDLRRIMEEKWQTLGPKLRGKLHIAAGDADNFYLNNAVHLLDEFLSHANPSFEGKITFGPGKGHGWQDIDLRQMMKEMQDRTTTPQ